MAGERPGVRQDTRSPTPRLADYRIANRKTSQACQGSGAQGIQIAHVARARRRRMTAGSALDQHPATTYPITRPGTAVSGGQHKLAGRPTNRRRPVRSRRRRGLACECDMRTIRTRIGGETAGRELLPKIRDERRQFLGRRCRRAPKHARPRKMTDPIDLQIECSGTDPIRGTLRTSEHVGRERAEECKRQMKVARVGCPCADGQERGDPGSHGVADRLIGPQCKKPAFRQDCRAARPSRRSPPVPSNAARHRDRRRSGNAGSRLAPWAKPRPDRRSRPVSRDFPRRVRPHR